MCNCVNVKNELKERQNMAMCVAVETSPKRKKSVGK